MRFVLKIFTLSALCAAALTGGAQAQTFARADSETAKAPRDPSDLRRRAAGSQEFPRVIKGLYAERAATSLGHISAMISTEDGSLYALGKDSGALYHLADRGLDGHIDTRRTLTAGFQTPSGLTYKYGDLYVSDSQAIWRVNIGTGVKTQFVSLRNIKAGEDRPLLSYEDKILLGLSLTDSLSQVLSIDGATGVAMRLSDIPEAPLRGLSYGGGQLWAAVGASLRPIDKQASTEFAKSYPLEDGAAALAVMLPSEDTVWPHNWPAQMKGHVLAIQGPTSKQASPKSSGGNNIVAIPTQFGAPMANLSVIAGGFLSRDGQSAWAAPTAILMDTRGLFYADRLGGTIWRVSVDDRPAPKPRAKIGNKPPPLPVQKPSLKPNETPAMSGSMIGEASGLGAASTLLVGSRLKAEHDKKEAEKLAADKAKETADLKAKEDARKARRMSRQPSTND